MSITYRVVGALVIAAALAGAGWYQLRGKSLPEATSDAGVVTEPCPECVLPESLGNAPQETPAIPSGSGLPALAEFGSDECKQCQLMATVLAEVEPKLAGRVDIVRVDTDDHPQAAQEWRLRVIPTQVLVDAEGKELWRHEGTLTAAELLTVIDEKLGTGEVEAGADG